MICLIGAIDETMCDKTNRLSEQEEEDLIM